MSRWWMEPKLARNSKTDVLVIGPSEPTVVMDGRAHAARKTCVHDDSEAMTLICPSSISLTWMK